MPLPNYDTVTFSFRNRFNDLIEIELLSDIAIHPYIKTANLKNAYLIFKGDYLESAIKQRLEVELIGKGIGDTLEFFKLLSTKTLIAVLKINGNIFNYFMFDRKIDSLPYDYYGAVKLGFDEVFLNERNLIYLSTLNIPFMDDMEILNFYAYVYLNDTITNNFYSYQKLGLSAQFIDFTNVTTYPNTDYFNHSVIRNTKIEVLYKNLSLLKILRDVGFITASKVYAKKEAGVFKLVCESLSEYLKSGTKGSDYRTVVVTEANFKTDWEFLDETQRIAPFPATGLRVTFDNEKELYNIYPTLGFTNIGGEELSNAVYLNKIAFYSFQSDFWTPITKLMPLKNKQLILNLKGKCELDKTFKGKKGIKINDKNVRIVIRIRGSGSQICDVYAKVFYTNKFHINTFKYFDIIYFDKSQIEAALGVTIQKMGWIEGNYESDIILETNYIGNDNIKKYKSDTVPIHNWAIWRGPANFELYVDKNRWWVPGSIVGDTPPLGSIYEVYAKIWESYIKNGNILETDILLKQPIYNIHTTLFKHALSSTLDYLRMRLVAGTLDLYNMKILNGKFYAFIDDGTLVWSPGSGIPIDLSVINGSHIETTGVFEQNLNFNILGYNIINVEGGTIQINGNKVQITPNTVPSTVYYTFEVLAPDGNIYLIDGDVKFQ